jgi:uncharacterized BrkB/YihY/UPF0761 family membrane protein
MMHAAVGVHSFATIRPEVHGAVRPPGRPRRAADRVIALYWGSGVCDDVPALAWFLAVGLVPLALGLTALASLVLGDAAQAQAVAQRAARVLPADVSDQVVQLILRTRRDSVLVIMVSIVAMVWTSAGAVGVIERVMSRLLARRRFGPLGGKVRHLGLAAGLVVVIVLMVLAASKTTGLQDRLGIHGAAVQALLASLGLLATAVVCAALYRLCPRDGIPWGAALAGAVPAAAGLQLVPTLGAVYLQAVAGRTPVQVFLVLAGVLIVCNLAAMSLLVGAAIAAGRTPRV